MGYDSRWWLFQCLDKGRIALGKDSSVYILILLYIGIAWLAAWYAGASDRFSILVYPATTVRVIITLALSALVVFSSYVALIVKPPSFVQYVQKSIGRLLCSEAFFRASGLLIVFSLFFSSVSSFKALIPVLQPFAWDEVFIHLDQVLHVGKQPWQWLQPVFGYPWVTVAVNAVYNLWFFVMFMVLFWQFLDVRKERRRQAFLVTFVLTWAINGSLLAMVFSSAGPCFLDRLFPGASHPFTELMAYLNAVNETLPVWAITTQDALWRLYEAQRVDAGAGISAMPSMHVSVAWLIYLLVRREAPWMHWLAVLFVAFILIGSVHLGWHYAIDGYFSIASTSLIWWLVGKRAGVEKPVSACDRDSQEG